MNILDIGNNKTKCQHFTPEKIADKMLDLADYNNNLIGKAVLENSFGSGNILKAIVKRYIAYSLSQNIAVEDIAKNLENDIYGIELDQSLYENCLNELNSILDAHNIPRVKWKLFNENALEHQYNKKFDLVIGNPPYISYKELDEESRTYIKKHFDVCKTGKPDYCYAFIELGINLLTNTGKLIQLIPNNIFKNVFAQKLRERLKPHISKIIDYPNQKLFGKALTSISVFLFDKSNSDDELQYENATDNTNISILRDNLSDKWLFSEETVDRFEYVRFGDVFNASVAIATLCNKAFILNAKTAEEKEIEAMVLRKTVSPKTLRYQKENKIIFPYYYKEGMLKKYDDFEERFPSVLPR